MIIKVALVGLLACLVIYALTQVKRVPVVSTLTIAAAMAATVLVVFPEISTQIAVAFGVGRGADLIFYLFIVLTFMTIFFLYLKIIRSEDIITQIVRACALSNYRAPENDQ
jgi:hypothetical protein